MKPSEEKPSSAASGARPLDAAKASETSKAAEPAKPAPVAPDKDLAQRVKELEADRDRLKRELGEAREKQLRARADYDNLVKRASKDAQDTARLVKSAFLLRVAGLVETMETLGVDLEKRLGAEAKGFKLVLDEARKLLKDEGLRETPTRGHAFNYRFHQAVDRVETADVPDGTILDVVQRGYQLGEEVLRPALVRVAVPPRAAPASGKPASPGKPGST